MSTSASEPFHEAKLTGVATLGVREVDADVSIPIRERVGDSHAARPSRRVRRPKKVVYYFSSSSEEDEAAAPADGADAGAAPLCDVYHGDVVVDERESRRQTSQQQRKNPKCSSSGSGSGARAKRAAGYSPLDTSSDSAPLGGATAAAAGLAAECDRVIVIQNGPRSGSGFPMEREEVSVTNPRIGSPTPIGFFAFGMTTLLYNIHNAQLHKHNQATMGMVIFYGGLTQFVCGWFELINRNTFGCTISTTYGAFWMATAVIYLWPANENVESFGSNVYTGGFFFLWFVFAGTLFVSSFRTPLMCICLFFSVMLNFFLQMVGFWCNSQKVAQVAGFEGIGVGALATYIGMAFTIADVYGRNILPLFPHEHFRNWKW